MKRGLLITIEGIDGAGKSTLAAALEEALKQRGIEVQLLREPGGVRAAELIRAVVKDPALHVSPRAEALLYAAARAQLVEEAIEPLQQAGILVLLDRFIDSSLAYQGGGRGLGIGAVREINRFGTGGLLPDRTLWLALEPAVGRARSRTRADPPDRLEHERDEFFARTEAAYAELFAQDSGRIRKLDAAQPRERVLADALAALADLL